MSGKGALDKDRKMTDKQKLFCIYYVDTLNQTKAAELAGYSKRSARQSGTDCMKNPAIRAEIEQLFRETTISRDEVTSILTKLAKTDISDYTDQYTMKNGEVRQYVDIEKMKREGKGFLIKGIKQTNNGTTIEFDDRLRAVEILSKVQGFMDDKPQDVNVNVQVEGLQDLLRKVYGSDDNNSDD